MTPSPLFLFTLILKLYKKWFSLIYFIVARNQMLDIRGIFQAHNYFVFSFYEKGIY